MGEQRNSYSSRLENRARKQQELYQSLKAKADAKRRLWEKFADVMTEAFGSMTFLILNVVIFAAWIVVNEGMIAGVEPFDPYPYEMLTTAVSIEAIILAIVVLISQNRAARIGDLRQELDLQVNVKTEAEITKVLELVCRMLESQQVDLSRDHVLRDMLKPMDVDEIEAVLEEQVVGKL